MEQSQYSFSQSNTSSNNSNFHPLNNIKSDDHMDSFNSLIDAINHYKSQGYIEDFNLKQNCLECRNGQFKIFHNEFVVIKYFRFEEDTNPDDQSIIYAIESDKYNLKGILINGYGIYTEPITDEMLNKLIFNKDL